MATTNTEATMSDRHPQAKRSPRTARLAAPGTANGPDRLLTAQEVHARIPFSVDWLYRKARAGALPFARPIGRKVLFSEAGLAKWLTKRTP